MKRWLALSCLALLAIVVALAAAFGGARAPAFAAVRAAYRPSYAALLDRRGEVIEEVRVDSKIRRLAWTALAEVSPALVDAVIASEDRRFRAHRGIDPRALVGALVSWLRAERPRGASTITMQLAGVIDGPGRGARRRSLGEKLRQMRIARAIEAGWSKDEILEAYLNLVSFRGELQGIGAASSALYGKAPQGLDGAEAAVLASLIRSPNAGAEAVRGRARRIVEVTRDVSSSSIEAAVETAFAGPSRSALPIALAPHVAARLRVRFGETMRVRSTLDARIQRLAIDSLRRQLLAIRDRHAADGAVLVVDNESGDVLAYVGSSAELSSARHVDGVRALRQAGSALKPFLYATAFDERLLTPASLLEDTPLEVPGPTGVYRPDNYDREFHGLVSARTALASSLNVPAVRTALLVGVDRFASTLRALGFERVVEGGEYYGPALALGSVEVTLWEIVAAYRAIANGGAWSPLRLAADDPSGERRRVHSPQAAFLVASILADRESRSATFGLENPLATPFWSAVKTGTSKDMRDNWCIGFSRRYTVGVWVGNFSGEPMRDVTGISGAAPAWLEILSALEAGDAPPPAEPPGIVAREVAFSRAAEPARSEWFIAGSEPDREASRELARRPRILFPTPGSVIARDPDIPRSRQRIAFEADAAPADWVWRVDGRNLGSAASAHLWEPRPGQHELALIDRERRSVDSVRFVVRP